MFGSSREVTFALIKLCSLSLSERTALVLCRTNSVFWFLLLNIFIQPLQLTSRNLVIENCNPSDQVAVSAWAGFMQGIGSIIGFTLGVLPASKTFSSSHLQDFSVLCICGALLLLATTIISALVVNTDEQVSASRIEMAIDEKLSRAKFLNAPKQVWQIFIVQFFAWSGWFPVRTYYTRSVSLYQALLKAKSHQAGWPMSPRWKTMHLKPWTHIRNP